MQGAISSLIVVALFFTVSACGKKAEEKAPGNTVVLFIENDYEEPGRVDLPLEPLKIEDRTSQAAVPATGNGEIPDEFPRDVFLSPNSKVLISKKVNGRFHFLLESNEAIEILISSYKGKMKFDGWNEIRSVSQGTASVITFKKEKRKAIITFSPSGKEKAIIQLQILPGQ